MTVRTPGAQGRVFAALARAGELTRRRRAGRDVFNYLLWSVLDGARATNAYKAETFEDKNGHPILSDVIDEEKFPEEIGWMKYFAQDHRPSPAIEAWLARKRHAFVDDLKRDPGLMADMKRWQGMTAGERKKFLVSVIDKRMESFSDKNFSFAMPDIEIDEDRLAVNPGSASARENKITLSKAVLEDDNLSASLATIYHEGTHNVLTQLALAAGQNLIPERDHLHEDIQKFLFTRHYGLAPPGEIVSLYLADDEERIASQEGEYFVSNLNRGHGLKARFFAACDRAIDARERGPETFGLRALVHDLRFG